MSDFKTFQTKIGYEFKNERLLSRHSTHRSFLNENRSAGREHNERLEFLGDAVLELAVTEFLFAKYPEKAEGELTAYRAALVNTVSIADAAGKLGMNEYLMLSRGESRHGPRAPDNSCQCLRGAHRCHLSRRGLRRRTEIHREQLFHKTDDVVANRLWQDAKSKLQETAQEELGITPAYRLLEQSGPDHDKQFVVGAYIGQEKIAQGEGRSKQEAEQDAAQKALAAKGW